MKTLNITIAGILLFSAVCIGQNVRLANEDKAGLYSRSIEQVLRLDDEDIDIATAVLIVSEQWNDNVQGRYYVSKLDDMTVEIRNRLKAKNLMPDYKAIPIINKYLFDELGFKSVSEANNPNDLFLHSVLDSREGYCLSLSVLYLSIGERLGMPLYGVVVPGHFFVRYDDGRTRFNIETTCGGGQADDAHYIKKFKVPRDDTDSIYMKNLTNRQTLGCFFNNLGNSYKDVGNTASALKALETAVEINPSLPESRANLGNIYLDMRRIDDAIRSYQLALKTNPDDAKTHNNLGNAYGKQNRTDAAISEYNRSLDLDPNFNDVYINLAAAYSQKKMFDTAVFVLKRAIALEPKNSGFHNQLANVYCQSEKYEDAIAEYQNALNLKKDLADAYYGMGLCYNKTGQSENEIEAYKNVLAIRPDMAAALGNLGNVYFKKQEFDTAIEQYKKAILITPEDNNLYYNLGAAYSNKNDYEPAAANYLKAVKIDPKLTDAHNALAFAFYKLAKYDLAMKHIKIAEQTGAKIDTELLSAIKKNIK